MRSGSVWLVRTSIKLSQTPKRQLLKIPRLHTLTATTTAQTRASPITAHHYHDSLSVSRYCMNPSGGEVQVLGENASPTQTAAKETGSAKAEKITAVSDCHMHETSL